MSEYIFVYQVTTDLSFLEKYALASLGHPLITLSLGQNSFLCNQEVLLPHVQSLHDNHLLTLLLPLFLISEHTRVTSSTETRQ